jgi:hypothetical protein
MEAGQSTAERGATRGQSEMLIQSLYFLAA